MIRSLIITDLFKLRKNFIWKLIFIIPILSISLLQLLVVTQMSPINDYSTSMGVNGWMLLISQNSGPVLWPSIINLIIMLTSIAIYQVEFKENSFNTQMCFPVSKSKIFLSKFLIILFIIYIYIIKFFRINTTW